MQSFCGSLIRRQSSYIGHFKSARPCLAISSSYFHGLSSLGSDSLVLDENPASKNQIFRSFHHLASRSSVTSTKIDYGTDTLILFNGNGASSRPNLSLRVAAGPPFPSRTMTTVGKSVESASKVPSTPITDDVPHIKFKRLDKTARHIMQILDKEAVQETRAQREIPDIKPGYIVQLKVEVPENKRRVSIVKGIVIARRNAGLNTTFRLRRLVAGVGVESLFPLYSPNIKEIKVLEKKKVRRAKLYYLRDKMNALKK
ncbi:50S ribosomal protein L19, chloroplastic [Manihot esculenta]|uniref:Uncharacterized protein n=1 Tax=Manihot esculenta TaxID=3983 RepID=A0A251JAL4_MANES|nr:50S ribosomal protein L19, chloroplastic [Manihot esculenta]XP_043805942.1 50S ribosomal protein L19, chloroplastic [Manihot esculenta]OAY30802.1 hypothetical protein MANES_14G060000v8 [Manihot esculenta]OAY30803.1 hypothetical protein MANES_14G060000v8 [Manihot esculenta]